MLFREWIYKIIHEELRQKQTVTNLIERMGEAASKGLIAFYPCSKFSRQIIKEIKACNPSLPDSSFCSFDKSPHAVSEPGVEVYPFDCFSEYSDKISLLVIASSTYFGRQADDIGLYTQYTGPVIKTSYFDYTMPVGSPDEIVQKIKETCHLLSDTKSEMCYLISWLSRILNDEDMTRLFESENQLPELTGKTVRYKGYRIDGLDDPELKKELFSDVYSMKYVAPAGDDVVLDVGGFKGETAIVFADMVGKNGKVFAFEPINAAYQAMIKNIHANGLDSIITPINKGCSHISKNASAVSVAAGAPWSYISEEDGEVDVELVSIDDFVAAQRLPKVDFIKVDVEGFESDVLMGAQKVMQTFRPKLAVALYHRSSDMLEIPRLIHSMGGYKLYVRSNMDGPFGLNLFCV